LFVGHEPVVGLPLLRCTDVARYCLTDHRKSLTPRQSSMRCLESPTSMFIVRWVEWTRLGGNDFGGDSNPNRRVATCPELGHDTQMGGRIGAINRKSAETTALFQGKTMRFNKPDRACRLAYWPVAKYPFLARTV
jgi:hypothetical protein